MNARFDELSMRSFLSADANFLYCLAEGCPSGQIHDTGAEGPIFRCAACGYRMCTAHDPVIPFHENEVCTQYNERTEREKAEAEEADRVRFQQEEASAAEVGRSSVECPGCGVQIQKTTGCDHMTCKS
jgi:E3 ubiquitin-protein ligase RNF14